MQGILDDIIIDLATREDVTPFEANAILRPIAPDMRIYELTDRKLHVRSRSSRGIVWIPLATLAESVLS